MKRRQESEPALISVIFSFLLRLSEVKYMYHWSKSGKGEKTVNLVCLIRSDFKNPHGVGNLLHAVTIKNKSSTFGVRGRVKCTCTNVLTKFQSISG